MKCYKCDTELLNEWNYCPNCKKVIRKNKIVNEEFVACNDTGKCHQCSYTLNDNWNFCPICGDSVDFYENSNVSMAVTAVGTTKNVLIEEEREVQVEEKEEIPTYEAVAYCVQCGSPVGDGHLFCAVCGFPTQQPVVSQEIVNERNNKTKRQDKPGKGYILVALLWIFFQFGTIILSLLTGIGEFLHLCVPGVIITLIVGNWLYPNNKIFKAIFIFYITVIIIAIIAFVVSMFLFFYSCYGCFAELGG